MAQVYEHSVHRSSRSHPDGAADPFFMLLELTVIDRETISELSSFPDGASRDEFALNALKIGVLALRQARGQLDADLIQREVGQMLSTMQTQLSEHANLVQQRLGTSLKDYFDPESGRFSDRVKRLIEKDGDLERVLRAHVGDDSQLCKTLVTHVGEQSPLMKLLKPDESQGLLAALRDTVGQQLQTQRDRVLAEFSLNNKEGALCRLVDELSESNGQLTDKLQEKIEKVMREFSLQDDGSFFSRLQKTLDATSQAINRHLTLDDEQSALARLKREVMTILSAHAEVNSKFQEDVKIALGQMLAKREESLRSTRHGVEFEKVVCEFIEREAQHAGDIAERTGDKTGLIRNRKYGDCVIELGPDSAAPGAKIVVEAKEEGSYSLPAAREEIDNARKNREAQVGLFVFSRKTAPDGLDGFARYGNDVFVVWDAEDALSDVYLKAGLTTARALCLRCNQQSEAQAADFRAIDQAILEIEKRSAGLEEICTWTKTIQNNGDKILQRIEATHKSLAKQVDQLRATMLDLRQSVGNATT
jgi:hypothetical protein